MGEFIDNNSTELLAADPLPMSPTIWLGHTNASHYMCHQRDFFIDLSPLSGPVKIKQVQGTVDVTHHGTMMLQVDSISGKTTIGLKNMVLIESTQFNIISLQRLRAVGYVYISWQGCHQEMDHYGASGTIHGDQSGPSDPRLHNSYFAAERSIASFCQHSLHGSAPSTPWPLWRGCTPPTPARRYVYRSQSGNWKSQSLRLLPTIEVDLTTSSSSAV